MSARRNIFVSYSHKDKKLFEEFETMMAPVIQSGTVDLWDDQKILPGAKWEEEIQKALASASIAVLLVSQNFLASHFIAKKELPPLLKAAREEGVTIFWIYLSPCLFDQTEIKSYQAAHDVSHPLDRLSKSQRQSVLSKICEKLLAELKRRIGEQPELRRPSSVGDWLIVTGSFARQDGAEQRTVVLTRAGFEAKMIDTNEYPMLTPNLWAVVVGPFESRDIANAALARIRATVPDAYVMKKGR